MLNEVLRFFGLITVRQASHINRETARLLTRSIAKMAEKDFGVGPNPSAEADTAAWADGCFELMVNHKGPEKSLVGAWEL